MPTFTDDTHDIEEFPYAPWEINIVITEWMSVITLPRTEGIIWPI